MMKPNMLRNIFTRNLGTKVAAIALALVVWGYTNERLTHELSLSLPIRCSSPTGFEIISITEKSGNPVDNVSVRIQGARGVVRELVGRLSECNIKISASLEEVLRDPIIEVQLSREHLNLPPEVTLEEIVPCVIYITLERVMTRMLQVDVEGSIRGKPADGYRYRVRTVRPSEVNVSGPESVIRPRNSIPLAEIDITERTMSFSRNVSIVRTLDGKPVYCEQEVYVEIEILPELGTKSLGMKTIKVMLFPGFPHSIQVIDDPDIEVTIKGPQEILSKPGIENMVTPYVDITEIYGDDIEKYVPGTRYSVMLRYVLDPELQGKISIEPQSKSISIFIETSEEVQSGGGMPR